MDETLALALRYGRAAWRRRWLGVIVAWVVCALGWLAVQRMPDTYEASARIYVDTDAVLTPLLQGLAVDVSPNEQLQILQRTLLSTPNLQNLISRTDLGLYATTPAQRELMIGGLKNAITLRSEERDLFSIAYKNPSPRLARDVVQTLLAIFTESATANHRRDMDNAQAFLREQIASYEQQLHAMEERQAHFRARYAGVLSLGGADGGLWAARGEVQRAELALEDAQDTEARLKLDLAKASAGQTDVRLRSMVPVAPSPEQSALAQAEARLRELQAIYTNDFPGVIAQKKLIEQLRRAPQGGNNAGSGMPSELYTQLTLKLIDTENTITALKRQLKVAQDNLSKIEAIRQQQPTLLAEYQNMDRDYAVMQKNYDELLARLQSATISQAADTQADKVHIRVVDPPEIPLVPTGPNRPLLITAVLVLGLGAGVGVAVLIALLDRSFTSAEDLRELGLPVLGTLSVIGSRLRRRRTAAVAQFALCMMLLVMAYGGLLAHVAKHAA